MPMISTGGDQLGIVDGAFRHPEHAALSSGCSSLPMGFSAGQELGQHEVTTCMISTGPPQDTPEAVLIMQQHSIITVAVSRAMMRWAVCRLRGTMNT